jgi:hypothetical protein
MKGSQKVFDFQDSNSGLKSRPPRYPSKNFSPVNNFNH